MSLSDTVVRLDGGSKRTQASTFATEAKYVWRRKSHVWLALIHTRSEETYPKFDI
jgi:hypothetical protein